ncbi:MAG: VWA domain-containing protein [Alphaproteobacteria bacterium]|nr:VWA domain-containing protein [Alphaproteobacteria bacterium]
MTDPRDKLPSTAKQADVNAFLAEVAAMPAVAAAAGRGRLIFALDATASREPTWGQACRIQNEMFVETAALGGLEIQLVHYYGFGAFEASSWFTRSDDLLGAMGAVQCMGGQTQIARVLDHARAETARRKVNALVFVGDCMEEDVDALCHKAGQLGLLGVPAFVFHEGKDQTAERAFRQIAKLTNGAYCRFDQNSAHQLRELLAAVAVFAAGGRKALADFGRARGGAALLLTQQLGKG